MRRRLLIAVLCTAIAAALAATPAGAYFRAGGIGAGTGSVGTVGAGNQPSVSVSGQTVTVSWAQTSFAGSPLGSWSGGGYTVRRYPAAGGAAITPGSACNVTISGSAATLSCQENVTPLGAWKYTVQPLFRSWTGPESAQSATAPVAPAAPALGSATAQNPPSGASTGDIALVWSSVSGATGYNVYRRVSGGSFNFATPLNGGTPLTSSAYTDPGTGLAGGTTYDYVVRAVTAGVESASSNVASATAISRPAVPASITATPSPAGAISVSWPSAAGATGYNLYRRTSAGSYNYAAPLNGATPLAGTSTSDTTAVSGTGYRYVVRAVKIGVGGVQLESADSPESALATADATVPTGVTLTNPGSPLRGTVTLSGTASDTVSGIATLAFQTTTSGGSTWTTRCTATVSPYSCGMDTTLVPDGLYDLRVVASDRAGNTTTSASVTNRRIDNTAPATSMTDPGAYLRATVTLGATASDGGSGLASLLIQRAPTGTSTWTTICTVATSPASCSFNTTTVADGAYDLRSVATDIAGNVSTSVVANRRIDNTKPTGTNIEAVNGAGGIAGRPTTGDVITYTFSEPMAPASILAAWSGAATPVVVRFTNGNPDVVTVYNSTNTTQLALGSFRTGRRYVTANVNFTGSTMTMTGNTVVVVLGTPSGTTSTGTGTTNLRWTTSTAATDLAGNTLTSAAITEAGAGDVDF